MSETYYSTQQLMLYLLRCASLHFMSLTVAEGLSARHSEYVLLYFSSFGIHRDRDELLAVCTAIFNCFNFNLPVY